MVYPSNVIVYTGRQWSTIILAYVSAHPPYDPSISNSCHICLQKRHKYNIRAFENLYMNISSAKYLYTCSV